MIFISKDKKFICNTEDVVVFNETGVANHDMQSFAIALRNCGIINTMLCKEDYYEFRNMILNQVNVTILK